MRLIADRETCRGNSIASMPFKMRLYVLSGSFDVNGGRPVMSSKISTPSAQQSTALSWPLLRIISGATYSAKDFSMNF